MSFVEFIRHFGGSGVGGGSGSSLGKFHTSSPSQPKQWFSLSISFYQTFWGNIKWWLERFPILTYCPVHMESLSSQVNTSQRGEHHFSWLSLGRWNKKVRIFLWYWRDCFHSFPHINHMLPLYQMLFRLKWSSSLVTLCDNPNQDIYLKDIFVSEQDWMWPETRSKGTI